MRRCSTLAASSAMAGQPPVSPKRPGSRPAAGGEARQLVVVEAQVVLGEPQHRALGAEPAERHRRLGPAGQHDVAVGRQRGDQVGQPRAAARPGRQQVDVVEHQAGLGGRPLPHRVGHGRRGGDRGVATACSREPGPPPTPLPLPCPDAAGASSARATTRASRSASASWGSTPTHTSSPRGASRFSAMAWASSVVLPSPGPPVSAVTRWFHRPISDRSSRGRVSGSGRGSGGTNRNDRDISQPKLRRAERCVPGEGAFCSPAAELGQTRRRDRRRAQQPAAQPGDVGAAAPARAGEPVRGRRRATTWWGCRRRSRSTRTSRSGHASPISTPTTWSSRSSTASSCAASPCAARSTSSPRPTAWVCATSSSPSSTRS